MITLFDPTLGPATGKLLPAPRLMTLDGRRVAVLWNGRPHGDKVLRRVIELLRQKYAFEVVDFLKKPYIGNVAPDGYFDRIAAAHADAALVGVGD